MVISQCPGGIFFILEIGDTSILMDKNVCVFLQKNGCWFLKTGINKGLCFIQNWKQSVAFFSSLKSCNGVALDKASSELDTVLKDPLPRNKIM